MDPRSPICIAGMHRSGTSMTARLLDLCGVFLGPPDGMLPPQADNPQGFWELRRFVDINEALLAHLGGAWDRPPSGPFSGLASDPEIAPLRLQALQLAAEFRGREPWGFKDPRNSLTLGFWRDVLGPLTLVICVRNPLDVVRSLEARGSPVDSAYRVWEAHYRSLLRDAGDTPTIVVRYESFFVDAPAELNRLKGFLRLDTSEANLRAACGFVDEGLRRHVSSTEELIDSAAPASVVELYAELCRRACPVAASEATTAADVLALRLGKATTRIGDLDRRCARLGEQLERERKTSGAFREQSQRWRALAERGEPVRAAWRKMTALLADRDPDRGLKRHGVELADRELLEAVQLYASCARDEGHADVAVDLDGLGRRIQAELDGVTPCGETAQAGATTAKKA